MLQEIPQITLDKEVSSRMAPLRLGVLMAKAIIRPAPEIFQQQLEQALRVIAGKYRLDEVNKIDNIKAARNTYKLSGVDPNRYRPSADALIRRIVKGLGVSAVNNVVDILNYISITKGFSISGFDRDRISGDMTLGRGKQGEPYQGIGRGILNITGLPVFRDDLGAFGNPTSDSERTMITQNTLRIIFIFYDFGMNPELEGSLEKCKELLGKFGSAEEIVTQIYRFD